MRSRGVEVGGRDVELTIQQPEVVATAAVGEHLLDVLGDPAARVEAGGQRLGEADAEVDRGELAQPDQRAHQLQPCAEAACRLLQEAQVVRPERLVEVEVLEVGGNPLVEHLHHLVRRDPVGEHPGDEGAGAGADVDVEVVYGAVDREQVERAQGADLVDPTGEAAAAEHESGLRGPFAAGAAFWAEGSMSTTLPINMDYPRIDGERLPSGLTRRSSPATCGVFLPLIRPRQAETAGALRAPADAARTRRRRRRAACSSSTPRSAGRSARARRAPPSACLEHEAVHDGDRAHPLRAGRDGSPPGARRGPIDRRRDPPRQPIPEGRRRPDPRHPRLLRPLPRRPGNEPLRPQAPVRAAGVRRVTGRLYADDSIFDRRRGVADSGYATSPYIGPLSGLSLNSGYRNADAAGFASDPAKVAASKLVASLRASGVRIRRRIALGEAAGAARDAGRRPLAEDGRRGRGTDVYSNNFFAEMLIKLIGAEFGARRDTSAGARVVERFARGKGSRCTRSTAPA